MEVQIRATLIGCTKREKDGKVYATLHCGVPMRQGKDAFGHEAREFSMDGGLFDKLRQVPQGSPVMLTCEQIEWTKDGHAQMRQSVIAADLTK